MKAEPAEGRAPRWSMGMGCVEEVAPGLDLEGQVRVG